ncbi:hypothetical protein EGW08_021021 [Elysia chlorotica]|uniref:Uncharacterized protein n=1 Tax=Elysia chlorotica TaxID=188477 RepID=A0A433SPQ3_ELYCH|nr:hypothetical protein EGW08_021021 [Elysia chlorotica]
MTCLHWACSKGHLDAVKLLIEYNAFPNHMEFTEDRYTPLDYALMGEHHEVAQYMIEQGALSITGIQDIAAQKIQCAFRGYRVRKAFIERKKLLMKHEKLKKEAARKRAAEEGKKAVDDKKTSLCNSPCGTQSRDILDSNQDQQAQLEQEMLHCSLQADSALSLDEHGADERQDPQAQLQCNGEEALQEQDLHYEKKQAEQSFHQHNQQQQQSPRGDAEVQKNQHHEVCSEDQQQKQQLQKEADELTEMLRRSRLKMRKSEERRRKLLEQAGSIETTCGYLQQHKPQDVPVAVPQGTLHQHSQQLPEQPELKLQHKMAESSKPSNEQNHVSYEQQQPEQNHLEHRQREEKAVEDTSQPKKHRSRSRRKRRSRSRDSNGRTDSHQEQHKAEATEHRKELRENFNSDSRTEQVALTDKEKEQNKTCRTRRHRDHAETGRSHSPIVLPPSPRKEPQPSSQSPRKEDSRKREDTHLPALVLESCTGETSQTMRETDTSKLPSPVTQRDKSESPSRSPFPSSHPQSLEQQHHRHSHKGSRPHSQQRSRRRRSRHEVQQDIESAQGQKVDVEVDQRKESVSPRPRESSEKHRHRSRNRRDKTKTEDGNCCDTSRKSTDKETLPCHSHGVSTQAAQNMNTNLNKNNIDSNKDYQEKFQSKSGQISKEGFEQVDGERYNKREQYPQSEHQKQDQDDHKRISPESLIQQQQQQEERTRQAELRKRELSKRYQGERMHSSHRERQRQTPSRSAPNGRQHMSTSHVKTALSPTRQKPAEPDEREIILAGKTHTHAITMNERKRREDLQRKVEAATVIQRSWRR